MATTILRTPLFLGAKRSKRLYHQQSKNDGSTTPDGQQADDTSKNVGDLNVGNANPISFNHLTGHFTEALVSTDTGGADQTASWGGTPIVRPAVANTANMGQIVALDS